MLQDLLDGPSGPGVLIDRGGRGFAQIGEGEIREGVLRPKRRQRIVEALNREPLGAVTRSGEH
jgi:hypothetical protein